MQETMLEVVDLNSHRTSDFQIKLDMVKLSARSKRITIKDAKLKLPTMVMKVGRLSKYMNEKISSQLHAMRIKVVKKLMNSGYISKVQPRRLPDVTG